MMDIAKLMKTFTVALVCMALVPTLGFGQERISFKTTKAKLEKEDRPAFVAEFPAEKDEVAKSWKGFLKDEYKIDVKKDGSLSVTKEVVFSKVSANRMTVYASFKSAGESTRITIWCAFGADIFMGSNQFPAETRKWSGVLDEFIVRCQDDETQREVDKELQVLKQMQNQLSRLQKDENELNRSVEQARKDIATNEQKIVTLQEKNVQKNLFIDETTVSIADKGLEIVKQQEVVNAQLQAVEAVKAKLSGNR